MKRHIPWDLLISHLKKETSPQEEQDLNMWRATDDNESLYEELVTSWNEIVRDSSTYHPDTEYYWQQLEGRMKSSEKKTFSVPVRKLYVAVAAASVFLLLMVLSSYLVTRNYFRPETSVQTYKALSGKSQMILPDGSVAWLNVGSTLSYETSFLQDRQVVLDGEALFDVRHEADHPFVVSAGDVRIKVYGTRFDVEAYPAHEHVKVSLLEGRVAVSAYDQELMLNPGDIASFNKRDCMLSGVKGDIVFESFWADHSYVFNAKPLSHICRYLERWYHVDIELDPTLVDQVYTFTVRNEPLETILQIMSRINPIEYSFEENKRVVIRNVLPDK
jgi:ferric-dicitrate binding protein FerR (iron transport regulator)